MTEHTVLDQIAARSAATRIVRWHDGRVAAGVARGLAARFDLDPVVVRVAFVVATTLGGVGIAAYLLAWALLPDDEGTIPLIRATREKAAGAIALVAVAGIITASVLTGLGDDSGVLRLAGLTALVAAGWWFWRRSGGHASPYGESADRPGEARGDGVAEDAFRPAPGGQAPGPRGPGRGAAQMPVITPWGGLDGERAGLYSPGASTATPATPSTTAGQPWGTDGAYAAPAQPGAYGGAAHNVRVVTAPRPPRPRRRTLGGRLWLIAIGLSIVTTMLVRHVALADGQSAEAAVRLGLAATAVVLGLLLVVVGLRGYRTSGLAPVASLVGAAALIAPMVTAVDGTVGEITWKATTVSDLQRSYDLGLGEGTLDLRGLTAAELGGHTVTADLGLGTLRVQVPADVPLALRSEVGMGTLTVRNPDGSTMEWEGSSNVDQDIAGSGGPKLTLDLSTGLGEVVIERTQR